MDAASADNSLKLRDSKAVRQPLAAQLVEMGKSQGAGLAGGGRATHLEVAEPAKSPVVHHNPKYLKPQPAIKPSRAQLVEAAAELALLSRHATKL